MTRNLILAVCLPAILFFASCGGSKKTGKTVKKSQYVLLSTSYGDMTIRLYNETPQHRDNFIKLVKEGYYEDLLFHRVIPSFMIQGGDPDSKGAAAGASLGQGGPGYTIPAEFDTTLIHKKGALAAARMGDGVNPEKASSGSQFYLCQGKTYSNRELDQIAARTGANYSDDQKETYATIGGTPHLDRNYTVFGEVVEGLDVIDKIAGVERDGRDRPKEDVSFTIKVVKR